MDGELSRDAVVYREPEATRFAAGGPEPRYPSPAVTGTLFNVTSQIIATEHAGHADVAAGSVRVAGG